MRQAIPIDELSRAFRESGSHLAPEDAVSCALSLCVPGPASLISPTGRGTRLVLLALKLAGYKIVPRGEIS